MSGFTGFSDKIPEGTMVQNAPFFPDLDLAIFQQNYRLPGEYREKLLSDRLQHAMLWANAELAEWKTAQEALGYESLATAPGGDPIGGISPLVLHYTRAVSCKAKAFLLNDYKTMLRKSDAVSDAKESDETEAKWHQYASDAINNLQGKLGILVEAL